MNRSRGCKIKDTTGKKMEWNNQWGSKGMKVKNGKKQGKNKLQGRKKEMVMLLITITLNKSEFKTEIIILG